MAVKITEDMYDTFTNNGYTQDDIQNTVSHYRDQGMPDSAIFTALNKKHRELAGIKDVSTPQIGDQPNYDAILNNPALTPQQQAEQIKQKGEAYRAGLDKDLAAQKAKMYTGAAIKIASPLVGLGLAPFTGGMSLPASMAVTGLAEGATFGLGEALQNQKTGADFAKDVATQGLLGGLMGAGTGALFKGASKILPKVFNRPVNVPKDVQELGELATNPQAYVAKTGRPVGLSRLPKEIVPLAEAPTVGEAPIQQVTPNKFAIEADTDIVQPTQAIEQPNVGTIEQPVPEMVQPQAPQPQVNVPEMVQPENIKSLNKQSLQKDLNVELRALRNSIELPEVTKGTYIKGRYKNRFFTKNITDDLTRDFIDADNALLEVKKKIKNNPANALQNMDILENKLTDKVGKLPDEAQEKYYEKFWKDLDIANTHEELRKKALTPEAFGYKEVQQQVPVPQGQMKTRGGIKTIEKGFGEDVANQVTDRTYETRGLARNEAEYANLTPEQQADLVNTDDISDLAIRAKQKNLENQMNLGAVSGRDLNKYAKQGTEQAQAFQARDNINTPVGALTATQSVIRKATPKRINNIIDNADNIVNAVTTARTSVAKVDNLNNALKGTVKRERKYLVDRILKLEADGQLNADNVIKLVNKKYNIPEITQNDLTKIQELTTNISNATTERDVQVAKGLLRKFMVDKVPKTMRNKVNTYRYINMLLSPKSRSKDFIFTAAFQGEQAIDEVFAQLPALASRVFEGINTRSGLHPKAWVGGLKKGFREGAEDVKLGIETGRAGEGTRFDLPRGQQFVYTPLKDIGVEPNVIKKIAMAGENVLSKLEKALNYTIRVPDRMFYEAKYASSIADQLKAANVKQPTSEMIEQAVKEAKDAVYQGDTWASKVSLGARDLLNKIPTGPLKIGDFEMPFVQTLANITEEGLKNTGGLPVGMAKWGAAKTPAELRDAELLIGKGLKSLGYLGVGGGIAAGAIKSNIGDLSLTGKDRDAVTGMQPQSIAIGNKSFSIANAPNVTIPIAIYKSLLDQGTPQDRALRAGMAAATAVGDMPAFKTLGDLVKSGGEILSNAFDDDTQGAIDAAKQMGNQQIANVTGQFIPLTGAMGNIRNIVDPYSREQYTQDLGQYITNKTINRIPFASQSLPMRYGITGEPVMMTNIKNPIARAAGELVDPFSVRNYTPNPTIDTMKSLTKQAEGIKGNKAFNIKKAKRSIDINGVRTKLSPKEYSQYQKDYGKINYYLRQKALKSKTWKMSNSEEKIKYMQDLNSSIDQAVKSVLFNHSPKRQEKYTQEIIDNYDTFTK